MNERKKNVNRLSRVEKKNWNKNITIDRYNLTNYYYLRLNRIRIENELYLYSIQNS